MNPETKRRLFLAAWSAAIVLGMSVPALAVIRGTVWIGPRPFHAGHRVHRPLLVIGADVWLPHGSSSMVITVLGRMHVQGTASDDIADIGGPIYLGPGTVARRDVLALGDSVYRAHRAVVEGRIGGEVSAWSGRGSPGHVAWPLDPWKFSRLGFAAGLALLLLCTCVSVAFPWQTVVAAQSVHRHFWRSLLAGLMGLVLFIFLAVPLGLSLFGLPFALLLAAAAVVAWLLGLTATSVVVGRLAARLRGHDAGLLWAVVSGMFAVSVVLALPWLGPLLVGLAGIAGAGGLALRVIDGARPGRSREDTTFVVDETLKAASAYIKSGRQ